jgi:hypothetical protein
MMIARCTAIKPPMIAGSRNTCAMNSRDSNAVDPGNLPPHSAVANGPPINGMTSPPPTRSQG